VPCGGVAGRSGVDGAGGEAVVDEDGDEGGAEQMRTVKEDGEGVF
jgi:hypothetical protein